MTTPERRRERQVNEAEHLVAIAPERARGDWFQTYTGKAFYYHDVAAETICLDDIAHSLAFQCRYNGHTSDFYSIAQHSVLVARCVCQLLGETNAKWLRTALFHDAAEAYIGDMVRPLKIEDAHFRAVEAEIEEAIAKRFDLIYPMPPLIKRADIALLRGERAAFYGPPPLPWHAIETAADVWDIEIESWSPHVAELRFLERAREYLTPA